jgi:DNA repair protein RadD
MSRKVFVSEHQMTFFPTDATNTHRFQLRGYQNEAVNAMMAALDENDRHPACIAATGGGKTIIMAAFIERYMRQYPDESVLVLAHRAELITQAAERFSHVLPHDLVPAIHCASLNQKDFGKVTVASVQTIGKPDVLAKMPPPGLVIVDEAHRIPTSGDGQYQRLLKTLGARHRDMRVAGFTATPWRLDGGHIVGLGNPLNHTAYQIEPALLMDEGFLVKPQWAKTLFPIETGKARSRKGDFLNEDLRSAAAIQHKERMQDVLTRTADRNHTIVFTIDRKHARQVAADLPGSVVVDGNTAPEVREQRIQDFADGKYRYLVNVDLFIEGFDLPKIDAVAVLRPTESAARWIQMVGRGLRTADDKTDCLVLDYGGNLDRFPMRPDEPGFFRYDPKGQGANVPGTLVAGPANPGIPVELPAPLTHDVTRVDATVFHSNHKDRDFLKMRYFVGMTAVEQVWVVPSKDFTDFWARHGFGEAPRTPQEAVGRVRDGDLLLPRAVSLRYRANPDKAFGYSEIVSEVHSWAETMANRHIFFTVPGHGFGESSGYRKGAPGLIRPTPLYGQKLYAALVERERVPESGQWVTAYPLPASQPVRFEKPVILFNNRTGLSYVAEKAELDRMLQNKLSFRPWQNPVLLAGSKPLAGAQPLSFDGPVSLLAPHEMGNLGYLCAQKQFFDAARAWWEPAAARGDVASQKNLALLVQWNHPQAIERKPTIAEQEGVAFAYGGGRRP